MRFFWQRRIERRDVGPIVILAPHGHLWHEDGTSELEAILKQLASDNNRQLIIKMNKTQSVDSTAIGILLTAHSDYVKRGGSIVLCGLRPRVKMVFAISRASLVFDVFLTEELALASFK